MIYIAYQGIYDGTNFQDANTPDQIGRAFNHGFSCMVDVWRVDDQIYLGTDQPLIPVTAEYLRGNRFWLNASNADMYTWLQSQPPKLYPNYFQFSNDTESNTPTTSGGQVIVPGNVPLSANNIMFIPELVDRGLLSTVKFRCYGVISNYLSFIKRMRFEGIWY
jgi:hypothetical protein